jgi:two-component system chemotaxis response regulator CheB
MRIRGSAADPFISLDADREPHSLHVPSINILLASVAETFGSRSLGAVLTGMGNDGADGLLAIRRAGGITLAQPSESAFMPSMPLAAIDAGAVAEVVPLESMSSVIAERVAGGF